MSSLLIVYLNECAQHISALSIVCDQFPWHTRIHFGCIMDGIVAFQVAKKGSITIILVKHFSIDFLLRWSTQCNTHRHGCARNELGWATQQPFAGIYYECCLQLHINVNTVGHVPWARFPFNRWTRDAGIKKLLRCLVVPLMGAPLLSPSWPLLNSDDAKTIPMSSYICFFSVSIQHDMYHTGRRFSSP